MQALDELNGQLRLRVFDVFPQAVIAKRLHERLILELLLHLRRSFQEIRAHQVMQDIPGNGRALFRGDLQGRGDGAALQVVAKRRSSGTQGGLV